MHPMFDQLLPTIISLALSRVPALLALFTDPAARNPDPIDPDNERLRDAIHVIADAIAHSLAEAAYQASLRRPHTTRATDPERQGQDTMAGDAGR